MATYCFFGESDGMGVAYDAPGYEGCLRRRVDLPHLIANPGKLALAASPTIPLTTFAGFVLNDVLELFQVPIGYVPEMVACRVATAEGATAASTIGTNDKFQGETADPNGLAEANDLNGTAGTVVISEAAAVQRALPVAAVADGAAITITFTTNDTYAVAIFEVAVKGTIMLPEFMKDYTS